MGGDKLKNWGGNGQGNGFLVNSVLGLQWSAPQEGFLAGGFFASVRKVGMDFRVSPTPANPRDGGNLKVPHMDLHLKYVSTSKGVRVVGIPESEEVKVEKKKKVGGGLKFKVKVGNASLRRLINGAVAGTVSRTAVAPLETIRTNLMVGSSGHSTGEVFDNIMKTEGWKGPFRGNLVNVIRVAPGRAVELLAYDTVNKCLSSKPREESKLSFHASLITGACAGVSSTLFTYPRSWSRPT